MYASRIARGVGHIESASLANAETGNSICTARQHRRKPITLIAWESEVLSSVQLRAVMLMRSRCLRPAGQPVNPAR